MLRIRSYCIAYYYYYKVLSVNIIKFTPLLIYGVLGLKNVLYEQNKKPQVRVNWFNQYDNNR